MAFFVIVLGRFFLAAQGIESRLGNCMAVCGRCRSVCQVFLLMKSFILNALFSSRICGRVFFGGVAVRFVFLDLLWSFWR